MKKFFELRMKSGRSLIASVNMEGICQFSINGMENSIYSKGVGDRSFAFSAEKKAAEDSDLQVNQDCEVVSLQEVEIKRNAESTGYLKDLKALRPKNSKVKSSFLRWNENLYFAIRGGVRTPAGWIYAKVSKNGNGGMMVSS